MASSLQVKICFVAPEIYPLFAPLSRGPYTDADILLYELARKLGDDNQSDVSVVTRDSDHQDVEYIGGVLVYRGDVAESVPWYKRFWKRPEGIEGLLEQIEPHVVVMAGASSWVGPVAEWCQRRKRSFVFLVSHPRDCDGTYIHARAEEGVRYRKALHTAKFIVSPTQRMARMLERTEGLKAVVLPPFVPQWPPHDAQETEAVWIGEIVDWTQPEYFMRLAATLPQVMFTMYARPRKPEYLEKLVEKTRDLPNLGFHNSVPYLELSSFVANARLVVNTSRQDGFPAAMGMAIRLGVPIATLTHDPDQWIEQRQLGICARGSEVRLAQEVLAILSYERQWNAFQERVRSFSDNAFNASTIYQSYWKLLLRAAGPVLG